MSSPRQGEILLEFIDLNFRAISPRSPYPEQLFELPTILEGLG